MNDYLQSNRTFSFFGDLNSRKRKPIETCFIQFWNLIKDIITLPFLVILILTLIRLPKAIRDYKKGNITHRYIINNGIIFTFEFLPFLALLSIFEIIAIGITLPMVCITFYRLPNFIKKLYMESDIKLNICGIVCII